MPNKGWKLPSNNNNNCELKFLTLRPYSPNKNEFAYKLEASMISSGLYQGFKKIMPIIMTYLPEIVI